MPDKDQDIPTTRADTAQAEDMNRVTLYASNESSGDYEAVGSIRIGADLAELINRVYLLGTRVYMLLKIPPNLLPGYTAISLRRYSGKFFVFDSDDQFIHEFGYAEVYFDRTFMSKQAIALTCQLIAQMHKDDLDKIKSLLED